MNKSRTVKVKGRTIVFVGQTIEELEYKVKQYESLYVHPMLTYKGPIQLEDGTWKVFYKQTNEERT